MLSRYTVRAEDLTACIETGDSAYVLVDPMLGEPLPDIVGTPDTELDALQAAREQAWGRPTLVVALDKAVPLASSQHPYLVCLEGKSDPWWKVTLDMTHESRAACLDGGVSGSGGGPIPIGGWLVSAMRDKELVDHLSKLFRLNTTGNTKAKYLRLADPRVLEWTRQVIGGPRLTAAFGRIRHWMTLDALGKPIRLDSPSEQATPLQFSTAEWRTMRRGEDAHRSVCMALGQSMSEERQLPFSPYDRVLASLDAADLAAKRWPQRFGHPRDRQVWAALCLARDNFADCEKVRGLMAAPSDPDEAPMTVRLLGDDLAEATLTPDGDFPSHLRPNSLEYQQ